MLPNRGLTRGPSLGDRSNDFFVTRGERPKIERGGGQGIQYLVSLQWPVVQLDFSDGMHMTENSYMPQSARMRAQIQACISVENASNAQVTPECMRK